MTMTPLVILSCAHKFKYRFNYQTVIDLIVQNLYSYLFTIRQKLSIELYRIHEKSKTGRLFSRDLIIIEFSP